MEEDRIARAKKSRWYGRLQHYRRTVFRRYESPSTGALIIIPLSFASGLNWLSFQTINAINVKDVMILLTLIRYFFSSQVLRQKSIIIEYCQISTYAIECLNEWLTRRSTVSGASLSSRRISEQDYFALVSSAVHFVTIGDAFVSFEHVKCSLDVFESLSWCGTVACYMCTSNGCMTFHLMEQK